MVSKGVVMICLSAISCGHISGCMRSSALPPPASLRHQSRSAIPPITQQQPTRPLFRPPVQLGNENPWKPTVPERDWDYIVIHHTASSGGSVDSIHQSHLKKKDAAGNNWLGIGYHFVIGNGSGMRDGEIQPTFRWNEQLHGAHAGNNDYNQHGIGVCLVGNFEKEPPTASQISAVKRLVGTLKAEYDITSERIVGHRDVKETACPGRYFPMAEVSQSVSVRSFSQNQSESPAVRLASAPGSRRQ